MTIERYGLTFEINKDFTASIVNSYNARGDILIPSSIYHNSHKYIITKIKKRSFQKNENLKSIKFTEDSELRIIEKEAFFHSSIFELSIPKSVEELQEGWCSNLFLTNIIISSDNKNFTYLDEEHKIIIGKSNKNNDFFDVLVFASRDIKEAVIPPKIKHICSFAFFSM